MVNEESHRWQNECVTLTRENLSLHEQVAALESREVCAAAHDNVETCGYCQRDALLASHERLLDALRKIWCLGYKTRHEQEAHVIALDAITPFAVGPPPVVRSRPPRSRPG